MIETITFQGESYPKLQAEGFAAQYAFPFAKKILKHCQTILDVGCNRLDWCYPGAIPIDIAFGETELAVHGPDGFYGFLHKSYHAMNLPVDIIPDAIFSSHFLEHFEGSWVKVLDYWNEVLPKGGLLFLYLPHEDQKYWKPWNNRKHVHSLSPELIASYLVESKKWTDIFVTSGYDLNHSFYAIASKA